MNWDAIEQRWHLIVGDARQRWNKFSEQELHEIAGNRDKLIQKLKEKYGMSQPQAEKEVDDFHRQQAQTTAAAPPPQTRTSGGNQ